MPFFCINVKSKLTLAFFFVTLVICLICFDFISASAKTGNIISNDDRVKFLNELGYNVIDEYSEEKQFTIPQNFNSVLETYNDLQKKAGYDLKNYCGRDTKVYKYEVVDEVGAPTDFYANIIVYENKIIGGDISSVKLDGEMYPLIKRNSNENGET